MSFIGAICKYRANTELRGKLNENLSLNQNKREKIVSDNKETIKREKTSYDSLHPKCLCTT